MNVLRGTSRNEGLTSGGLLRKVVVVAEVTLSFVLLIGSGLMFRSFLELRRIDPSFDPRGLLTFQVLGNRGGNKPEERAAFMQQIQERLRGIKRDVRPKAAKNAMPHVPTIWCTTKASTDFARNTAIVFGPGFGAFDGKRVSLHHR